MDDKQATDMMRRCASEIKQLRSEIAVLRPKADAYDNLAVVLGLLPRPSVGYGEDLVWRLENKIKELEPVVNEPSVKTE